MLANKRGVSEVLVTVILVVFSLIAIGIIWAVISNLIIKQSSGIHFDKMTIDAEVKGANVDDSTNEITLLVRRKPGEGKLVGYNFVFKNATDSEVKSVDVEMAQLEERYFTFNFTMNVSDVLTVTLIPLIEIDGKVVQGNIAHIYNIKTGRGIVPISGGGSECPDGICSPGENCPADAVYCTDNVCYNPTCDNGCGQTPVPERQTDTGCSSPYMCDGAGSCVECIDETDCGTGETCESGVCVAEGIPPDDLVLWLKFDDVLTDGIATDSSNYGNDGTCSGGTCPTYLSLGGVDGGAYEFEGFDDRLRISEHSSIEPIGLTLSYWVKRNGNQITYAKHIYKTWQDDSPPVYSSYGIEHNSDSQIVFYIGISGGYVGTPSSIPILDNTWYHVAATYDRTSPAPQQKIYVNGQLAGSNTNTAEILYDDGNDADLYLGSEKGLSPIYLFKGTIDDVRIYNRALSYSEIQDLYNAVSLPDETPPVRSNGAPTGNLPAGTTQTTISLTTDESATCRYSTSSGVSYPSMTNTFSTTGGTSHSQLITGLVDGGNYNYYVRCNDSLGNYNADDYPIIFSVGVVSSGEIIPLDRRADWSYVGVKGGIPVRTTNCATSACNTLWGGTVTSDSISNAISSAPINSVVRIPAGTYTLSSSVSFSRDNVTIRGQGMGVTTLRISNSPAFYFSGGGLTRSGSLTGGYSKDSNSIVVSTSSGISSGNMIYLYQDNDQNVASPNFVWTRTGANDLGVRFAALVTGVSGNTLTIDPPLPFSFSASLNPRFEAYNSVGYVGFEDLTIDSQTYEPYSSLVLDGVHNSWIKGVEIMNIGNGGVDVYGGVRGEIRDSSIHDTSTSNDGYGVVLWNTYGGVSTASGFLIENNIFYNLWMGTLSNGASYNVFGYNYVGDTSIGFGWHQTPAMNTNHKAHGAMKLYEGNVGQQLQSDGYHGSDSHNTVFRNWFHGVCGSYCEYPTGNRKMIDFCRFSWYNNVVGNILGHPSWTASAYEMTGKPDYYYSVIYRLGYPNMGNNYYSDTNPPTNGDDGGFDPNVKATLLRHGNFDYFTNGVIWDPAITEQNLPDSLYLPARPSWWCQEVPWPPIGPDVSGYHNQIPAQRRYNGLSCTPV